MDIRCPKCGEPWDIDTFHEVAEETDTTFEQAYAAFREQGCVATGWSRCNTTTADPAIGELMDLLGDDIDGAAAFLEDFERKG